MGLREKLYEMKRLEQIAACLFKYELHYLIDSLKVRRHLPLHKKISLKTKELTQPGLTPQQTQPQVLRTIFEELGGAFLKLGQVISLRPDLVGYDFAKEFEKVLDQVPPEDFKAITEVIDESLPKGMKSFVEFDSIPIAAGSIAQVHAAKLADGRKVAVKVQRPNVKETFQQDISIMMNLAERLKEDHRWDFLDAVELVEEFKKYTIKELDFNHEAVNMTRFGRNFQDSETVLIPKVYREYSNDRVLVMELLDGKDIYTARARLNPAQKKFVVETVSRMILKQIFEDGFFHADLHPGNIMYIKDGKDEKIGLLDFGIVGYLDKELKEKLFSLFTGLVRGDLIAVTDSLIEINVGDQDIDREALKAGLHYTLSDYYNQSSTKLNVGEIFRNAIDTARRSQIRLPSNLVLLSKSLFTVDGFCRELYPSFNIVEYTKPILRDISKRELKPKNLVDQGLATAIGFKRMISNLPRYVENFSRKVDMIEERITKYESAISVYNDWMSRIVKATIFAILLIPLLISSAILIDKGPYYAGVPIFSFLGFCASITLLISMLYSLNKKTRRQ
jgi:ubiquinone biosynthesis protein